jgi:WD40 repeat protein
MSKRRAALSLVVLAFLAAPFFAQPPAAGGQKDDATGPDPLPEGARLRLGNVGLGVGEAVSGASLSADGKYLAVAGQNGVTLFDRATGKRLAQVGANNLIQGFPIAVAFAPKGNRIACAGFRSLIVAEVPTGKLLHQLALNDPNFQQASGLTFSADGSVVAVGMSYAAVNQKIKAFAWEVATGKQFGPFEVVQNSGCSTALSPDGKRLATWGRHFPRKANDDREPAQTVQLWDVATGKELRKFKLDRPNAQLNAAAFSGDGKTLAIASGLSTFHLIDVETGKARRTFAGRRGQVTLLEFSPDGKLLVAGGADGTVQAWHTGSGERLALAAGPRGRLLGFGYPEGGQIITVGMLGQTIAWWDAVTGKSGHKAPGHWIPVAAVAFTPDGKTLRSMSYDGQVLSWDPASGELQKRLTLLDDEELRVGGNAVMRLHSVALAADAGAAATSSSYIGNCVRLWDLTGGQPVCDFEMSQPSGANYGLAFSGPGNRLAAASLAKHLNVHIWDCGRGEEVARLSYDLPGNRLGGARRCRPTDRLRPRRQDAGDDQPVHRPDERRGQRPHSAPRCGQRQGSGVRAGAGRQLRRLRRRRPVRPAGGVLARQQAGGPAKPESPCDPPPRRHRPGGPAAGDRRRRRHHHRPRLRARRANPCRGVGRAARLHGEGDECRVECSAGGLGAGQRQAAGDVQGASGHCQ